ncbi:N-acetylmuramoyl-L-alanine amidase [Sneathiella aquimaris]|uniref:N-acetylmuramoyl-L-alanine amidase n=1 Tax=Sneathiella aquimaris TaxID=2599305 RepID=UPI00146CF464|nr:N-acetylmuramoyl-L-alanine amidase [Sneathiella aquimaris]
MADTDINILWHPSPNFNQRRDKKTPTILVQHYTGMKNTQEALARLCDPKVEVSAHYLIDEEGAVYQLVDEKKRAWHAGLGSWRGETDINSASIGIEIVNPGHEFGYRQFSERQMQSVISLSKSIVERHQIASFNVIGHSDLAPGRKQDPGELFDWKRLAENGVGLWPEAVQSEGPVSDDDFRHALDVIGYEVGSENLQDVTAAFQRHWRQEKVDGIADAETRIMAKSIQNCVLRLTN